MTLPLFQSCRYVILFFIKHFSSSYSYDAFDYFRLYFFTMYVGSASAYLFSLPKFLCLVYFLVSYSYLNLKGLYVCLYVCV